MGIDKLVKNLNKEAGKSVIVQGNELPQLPRFSFGSLSLDLESGGGCPTGVVVSLVGEESAGKSVVAQKMVASYQKTFPDQDILWIDAEGAWDPTWAASLGVEVLNPKLFVMRPEYMEQAYNTALLATEENVGLIVIDSLAAMSPKDEAEEDIEKSFVGVAARLNRKLLRKFQSAINDANFEVPSTLVYINHLNERVGGASKPGMPPALVEPGGRALRFFPSVKILLKAGDTYPKQKPGHDEETTPKAREMKFHITKNKTAPPLRKGHFWFYFDTLDTNRQKGCYDKLEEIIRYSLKYNVVTRLNRQTYALPDPSTGELISFRGSGAVAAYIRDNRDAAEWVEAELSRRVTEGLVQSDVPLSVDEEDDTENAANEQVLEQT